jgi:DNA-binding transcriptional LysR family regulator
LTPALTEFLRRYPDVTVDLRLTNRTVDLIDEAYDLVFRTGPLPDSGLLARQLAPYRLVLCAAPAYLATHGYPAHPKELLQHECLVFSHTSMRREWLFDGPMAALPYRSPAASPPIAAKRYARPRWRARASSCSPEN